MVIRIGVTGTHSTGKTVLLKRIEMELRAQGVTVARTGQLGKRATAIGLPKMMNHTAASTEWIITQGIADEIAAAAQGAQVVLADRAAVDALIYFQAAMQFRREMPDEDEIERLRLLVATQYPKYDLLLATVLDPSVPVDQSHGYDPRFRALVDAQVHAFLSDQKLDHRRVTHDADDQAEAVRFAVETALQVVPA